MSDKTLPFVTVLVPAYNYERFVVQALQSALDQDYPADRFEVLVVDDGSTDGTADAVRAIAAANPGRVRLIQHENRGQIETLAHGRSECGGELIALLDADDIWLPTKLRRQVEVFRRNPRVGLVFCDMHTIDVDGRVVRPTVYAPNEFDPDRLYARILRSNVVFNSSLVVRPDLFVDPPDTICDWDWWIALYAGEHSEIAYVPEPLAQYRLHGDNMLFGATGEKLVRLRRGQLRFQLWSFRHMDLAKLSAAELSDAWAGAEWFAMTAAEATSSYFQSLVTVSDDDRAKARSIAAEADAASAEGDVATTARLRFRALAWDPYDPDAARLMREAVATAAAAERRPHPLAGSRRFVVIAQATELLGDERLLSNYAAEMRDADTVTLAVDAGEMDASEAVDRLQQLMARCGLENDDRIDVLAVVDVQDRTQRLRVYRDADAIYTRGQAVGRGGEALPRFGPHELDRLRALADSHH